ncbi:hypothetical protein [Halanaerobium hydrogeniformans]|uniref:Uncharacterized protein n=1 Tax=Halanaerobium hydrogeniformans TaxID=656519 RepID=E4RMH1_HALHG|nr:hypothetical protein [Halanaerobium hydrogeniformans]ADQ14502.1 hypothetical protein Halsa_1066 [Halanaerobium hydrogeniformans]
MVYIKICPECESRSISASKEEWPCPHCNKDLSEEPVFREIRTQKEWWKTAETKKNKKRVFA